jgi:cobalt transporter subunit CbtB
MSLSPIPGAVSAATPATAALPALLALCFGAAIVAFVGLSPMAAVHNAAHDARHAFAFPCH